MRRSRSEDQSEPTDVEVGRRFSLVFDGVYESSEAEPPRDGPAHHAADAGSALEAGSTREVAARRALAAFDPGRRGLRALAVVAVLVVVGAAVLAWRARPHADLVGTPSPVAVPASAASSASSAAIVVAVAGHVQQPGVVRLPPGARV